MVQNDNTWQLATGYIKFICLLVFGITSEVYTNKDGDILVKKGGCADIIDFISNNKPPSTDDMSSRLKRIESKLNSTTWSIGRDSSHKRKVALIETKDGWELQ